jgi:sec-independent protein translocase protein TatA
MLLFAFLSPTTLIVLGVVAVLIFGRRLPELAKSLGKSLTEFKKGMHGLENHFDDAVNPTSPPPAASAPAEAVRPPQRVAPAAPKFDDVPPPAPMPPINPPQP